MNNSITAEDLARLVRAHEEARIARSGAAALDQVASAKEETARAIGELMRSRYALGPEDSIDARTGAITRAQPAPPEQG